MSLMHIDWDSIYGNSFNKVRVLVTGGAGFIGSHLSEVLLKLGADVIVLDDLSGGFVKNLSFGAVDFTMASILDKDILLRCAHGCKYIFHQAALGSVPRSINHPLLYQDVNVNGTLNVLEAARQSNVKRVIFASSSSVYGDTEILPKTETIPPQPKSPYAANKASCEALMKAYSCSYGLDTASLRYFNVFGPRQNANTAYAAVIASFSKAISENKSPIIFGDGTQSRDFTFVYNVVHANLLAALCKDDIHGQYMNIACGKRITINELADIMIDILGKNGLKPSYSKDRNGDVKHSHADIFRAKKIIGYEPLVSFEDGIKSTVSS